METRLLPSHSLLQEARLARLNARRLAIQAKHLTDKAMEVQRLARRTWREVSRRRR